MSKAKKPTNAELQTALDKANKKVKRLETALTKARELVIQARTGRVTQEVPPMTEPRKETVTVAVGPVMPWEASLPNSFGDKS